MRWYVESSAYSNYIPSTSFHHVDGEDGVFLTDEQKRYYNAMKRMAAKAPSSPVPRPKSWFANKVKIMLVSRIYSRFGSRLALKNSLNTFKKHQP